MDYFWKEVERDQSAETLLTHDLGLDPLTARLLVNRGVVTPDAASRFLHPALAHLHDPFGLPDMDKAARRIADAIKSHEKIFVHGDYDVDGVTSTALFVRSLRSLGADVVFRVPHRQLDGYDLKAGAISWAHEQGATLVITTDCGIQAGEAIDFANKLGLTVVVTDHHEPGPHLPNAYATVNPRRSDSRYGFAQLAGVGVAFKTMQAVTRLVNAKWEAPFVQKFLDLVAVGTIADVMPLLDENRVLATFGLEALRSTRKTGLRALLAGASIDISERLSAEVVAYGLAPRINAVGRIDDAAVALELLLSSDDAEAERLVGKLNDCNRQRQVAQKLMTAQAVNMVMTTGMHKRPIVVIASKRWNPGVVGIVAGKLVEQFNRPALVIGIDDDGKRGKGSARSMNSIDIFEAISHCKDLLASCGGHRLAAGLTIEMEHFEAFQKSIWEYAEANLTESDFQPQLRVDMEAPPSRISLAVLDEWDQLQPFGEGNPPPTLFSAGVVVTTSRRMGKDATHLKLQVTHSSADSGWLGDAVGWGRADEWEPMTQPGRTVDMVYMPSINCYNGKRSVQYIVKDLRA